MDNPIHAAQPNRARIAGMTPRVLRNCHRDCPVGRRPFIFIPIITIVWLAAGLIDVAQPAQERNAVRALFHGQRHRDFSPLAIQFAA
jgi:hypothetical protein